MAVVRRSMIHDQAVSAGKLAPSSSGRLLLGQGSSTAPQWRAMSGDATIDSDGVVTVSGGAVVVSPSDMVVTGLAGATVAKGDACYVSSVTAAGVPTMSIADADVQGAHATWLAQAAILAGATGLYAKAVLSTANLNTNAAGAVGDPVYLTTTGTTTNTWSLSAPASGNAIVQIIGRVNVKSATVGQIAYDVSSDVPVKIGTNEFVANPTFDGLTVTSVLSAANVAADTGDASGIGATVQVTSSSSNATGGRSGIKTTVQQVTTPKTAGISSAVEATVVGLAGDTSGATYAAFEASAPTAGGSGILDGLYIADGYTNDIYFAAPSAVIRVQDGQAAALTIEDDLGQDFLVIDTVATDGMSFGNATTNPAFNFLGTGLTTVGGNITTGGDISATGGGHVSAAGGGAFDTIAELTPASGVTVDGCLIKDGRAALLATAGMFVSTEQTGTGASQDVAHGFGTVPSLVWFAVSDSGATGIYTCVIGSADATNLKFTCTLNAKFYALAIK